MTLDIFKGINLTAGQEVRAQDIKDLQNFLLARLFDGFYQRLVPGPGFGDYEAGTQFMFPGAHGADIPSNAFAYALSCGGAYPRKGTGNTKIQIAPGTLFQKVAASTGDTPTFLPYTFAGTEEVTIANGDATNPRVDIVQMKLELVNDDSQARVTATAGVKASRDLNPLTANCETVIRARAAGFGGNAISIQFVADGTGAGSLTQSGYALVFHYETGVTTVANFETAVAASALIEVQTTDGVGTLTSPGDTFGPVFLTGGTDQVLSSSNLMMKNRVQLTLNVKQGTPAASPTYPTADAGFVIVAGIVVPATWTGTNPPIGIDSAATTSLVIHDQRMPMGTPHVYRVRPHAMIYQGGGSPWTDSLVKRFISTGAASSVAHAPLDVGGGGGAGGTYTGGSGRGRLICFETSVNSGNATIDLVNYRELGAVSTKLTSQTLGGGVNLTQERTGNNGFELAHSPAAGPTIQAAGGFGAPVWTNGKRALMVPDGTEDQFYTECLALKYTSTGSIEIYSTTFMVAQGF